MKRADRRLAADQVRVHRKVIAAIMHRVGVSDAEARIRHSQMSIEARLKLSSAVAREARREKRARHGRLGAILGVPYSDPQSLGWWKGSKR